MKRRNSVLIGLVIVILVISLVSAWLILFSIPAPSNLSSSSRVSNGLQLTITLESSKTSYVKGEVVPVTFTIKNLTNQTLNFNNTNGDADFNFQIYDNANKQVYSWIHGAYPQTNATIPLPPSETYRQTLNWSQDNDVSGGFSQVQAGAYYIVREVGANTSYQLQTQPLNITITNP